MRRVPPHWWFTIAVFATTAVAASIGQLAGYAPGGGPHPRWELVSEAIGVVAVMLLPVVVGWHWRSWFLACFAVGSAFFVGLVVADALTYRAVWHNCNFPQADACDPGPFPATMMLLALPVPVVCTVVGAVVHAFSDQRRERRGEGAHLVVRPDGHADRAWGSEGS